MQGSREKMIFSDGSFIWKRSYCTGYILLHQSIYHPCISCQADHDGNGSLDYGEFVTLSVHLKKIGNDEHLHKAFGYFDRNQSGYIEIDELRESLADDLGQNHEEVINAIIRDVDTDKVCGSSPTSWQKHACFISSLLSMAIILLCDWNNKHRDITKCRMAR